MSDNRRRESEEDVLPISEPANYGSRAMDLDQMARASGSIPHHTELQVEIVDSESETDGEGIEEGEAFFFEKTVWYKRPFLSCFRQPNGEYKYPLSPYHLAKIVQQQWLIIALTMLLYCLVAILYLTNVFPEFTWQGWFSLIITVLAFGFLASDTIEPTFIFLCLMSLCLIAGVASVSDCLQGFCNSGTAAIAVLFMVSKALEINGAIIYITKYLLGTSKKYTVSILRMMLSMCAISAFVVNTPIVAIMIPVCETWSRKIGIHTSTLLMPLSFAVILGGTITNIGTSTNLIVLSQVEKYYPDVKIGFFDVGYAGVPAALVGIAYLACTAWLIPKRKSLASDYLKHPKEYTLTAIVGKELSGKTIEKAGLRSLKDIYLFEIERGEEIIPAPGPETALSIGDILKFSGKIDQVKDVFSIRGILPEPIEHINKVRGRSEHRQLFEAVISNRSPVIGQTAAECKFRKKYDAAIIAVSRQGEKIDKKIGDIELSGGDTLLLEASSNFEERYEKNAKHFSFVSKIGDGVVPTYSLFKLCFCVAGVITIVLLVIFKNYDLFAVSLVVYCVFVITGMIDFETSVKSMRGDVLFQVAAAFILGSALQNTGVATAIGNVLVDIFKQGGKFGALYGLYLTTVFLTALLTNAAAVNLVFPVAISFINSGYVTVKATVVIVMLGASCDFMTSVGYQTNIMVTVPGGYRFTDFTKIGVILTIIVSLTGTICTQFFFNGGTENSLPVTPVPAT